MNADATHATLSRSDGSATDYASLARLVGLIGLVIAFIGLVLDPNRGGKSWLLGYGFWLAVCVGVLMLTQISYLFDAGWSTVIRRQWEHVLAAFPWMAAMIVPVLIIPMLFGFFGQTQPLWKWMSGDAIWQFLGGASYTLPGAHPIFVEEDVLYIKKAAYLNIPFFFVRMAVYFAIFCGLSAKYREFSFRNDRIPNKVNYHNCRKLAGAGVPLTALALTFIAIDLFMSLSYHWFSTMYGVWFFAASMRAGLAITVIICALLATRGYLKGILNESHFYFVGCIKLAFTVFWAYIVFSQFFLIYNANIPEETFWFNIRQINPDGAYNTWWYVGLSLIFCNFVAPFIALLFYRNKVVVWRLVAISIWILFFAIGDFYYNILPAMKLDSAASVGYKIQQFIPSVFDLAALVGVGGIVVWATLKSMKQQLPIPVADPRIKESLNASH